MSALTPVAIKIGGWAWVPRLLPQITWVDRTLHRLTGGRVTLVRLAGLPSLVLTVVGRKSGAARSTPVLCVPFGTAFLIAGSNFGGPNLPVWVLNVRSADQVTVTFNGREQIAVPREIVGAERDAAWTHMLKTWPNYAKYAERTDREIPVFMLESTS
jgi:deazaflavin-dependent oxidoreductase (nitroreductase family)